MGDKVRDGKFEFTVTGIECGIDQVGNEYLSAAAQGQFCALDLTVTNIGDEPQHLFADNQQLYDTQGREFSSDGEATIYGNSRPLLFGRSETGV